MGTLKEEALALGDKLLSKDGKKAALAEWAKIKTGLCDGREPTEDALRHLDASDLKGAGVTVVFAKAWAKLFSGAMDDDTVFVAANASKYKGVHLATFYAANTNDAALNLEIDNRAKDGEWVIAIEGKVYPEQSGQFLDWLTAGDEPPRAIKVDGKKVTPVKRGAERVGKKHREDPSTGGQRLPVDNISKFTRVDFTDVSHECCQLYRVALSYELRNAGTISRREMARSMVGKRPDDFAEIMPDAFEAYETQREQGTLPSLLLSEETPPANPPVQYRDGRPPHPRENYDRSGGPPFPPAGGEREIPTGPKVYLPTDAQLNEVYHAIVTMGMHRDGLTIGIDGETIYSVPTMTDSATQIRKDLFTFRDMGMLTTGKVPIHQYIENAARFAGLRPLARVLTAALSPTTRSPLLYVVGMESSPEAWQKLQTQLALALQSGAIRLAEAVRAGEDRAAHHRFHMGTADIILGLVSGTTLLEVAALASDRRLLPVLLGPSQWKSSALKGLVVMPRNEQPLSAMSTHEQDQAYSDIATEVMSRVQVG